MNTPSKMLKNVINLYGSIYTRCLDRSKSRGQKVYSSNDKNSNYSKYCEKDRVAQFSHRGLKEKLSGVHFKIAER